MAKFSKLINLFNGNGFSTLYNTNEISWKDRKKAIKHEEKDITLNIKKLKKKLKKIEFDIIYNIDNNTKSKIEYIYRALEAWKIVGGPTESLPKESIALLFGDGKVNSVSREIFNRKMNMEEKIDAIISHKLDEVSRSEEISNQSQNVKDMLEQRISIKDQLKELNNKIESLKFERENGKNMQRPSTSVETFSSEGTSRLESKFVMHSTGRLSTKALQERRLATTGNGVPVTRL